MPVYSPTLKLLEERRQRVQQELKQIEREIIADYKALLSPAEIATRKMNGFVRITSKFWTIVDGVLMGYKLMNRVNRLRRWLPFGRR